MASTQQNRKKVAIGIDLGTTNSCVGVVRNGRVEIIANDRGGRLTPSYVAFTDEERLVGDVAKAQETWNPENTVFDVKRLIGGKFNDPSVQDGIKHWPFKVLDVKGNPKVQVEYQGQKKVLSPEEISAIVLSKMKETAETFLGHPVTDAVITVPANFSDSQRMATMDAGAIAGLNVLRILNEPTAAAIAYGVDKKTPAKRNILIYDFGGGTFDLVIIAVERGNFEVLVVKGNTHLGGSDIDGRILDHFVKEVKAKYNVDIRNDKKALCRLRKACRNVKVALSSTLIAPIQIECLHQGIDFESSLSRSCFEELCSDIFEDTMECVQSALLDSGLSKEDILDIVLCGGSTRIPKVHELLEEFFKGRPINNSLNPDEAVAYGAAMKASMLAGENTVEDIFLQEATPLSLGVGQHGDIMRTVIKRNTKIPVKRTISCTTVNDSQTKVKILIYEGERTKASLNNLLGHFVLEGVEDAPQGIPKLSYTFEVDVNGILRVNAVDRKTNAKNGVTITCNRRRLEKKELERMLLEEKQYQDNIARRKESQRVRNELEAFIQGVKFTKQQEKENRMICDLVDAKIVEACDEIMQWLKGTRDIQIEDCRNKKCELEYVINNLKGDSDSERKTKWPKIVKYVKTWIVRG